MGYNIYDELSEESNYELGNIISFCENLIKERNDEEVKK